MKGEIDPMKGECHADADEIGSMIVNHGFFPTKN
jgi:hypothetical protein